MQKLIVFLVLLLLPSLASAYTSLYDYPQSIAGQQRTSYRYQYDLDDEAVRCGDPSYNCPYLSAYNQYVRVNGELSAFKVYVPAGTTSTSLTVYVSGQTSQYVAIARWGQTPSTVYYPGSMDFAAIGTAGAQLTKIHTADHVVRNQAGIMTIIDSGQSVSTGDWVYVRVYAISGSMIGTAMNNIVNTASFMSWFRTNNWASFENPGAISGGTTPTPAPTAIPATPTPTPSTCNVWSCYISGGKCVNGVCVKPGATPVPTPLPTAVPTPTPQTIIDIKLVPGALYRFQ